MKRQSPAKSGRYLSTKRQLFCWDPSTKVAKFQASITSEIWPIFVYLLTAFLMKFLAKKPLRCKIGDWCSWIGNRKPPFAESEDLLDLHNIVKQSSLFFKRRFNMCFKRQSPAKSGRYLSTKRQLFCWDPSTKVAKFQASITSEIWPIFVHQTTAVLLGSIHESH